MLRRLFVVVLALVALIGSPEPVTAQRSATPRPRMHTVREGDTLARIARRYHADVEAIRDANHIRGDRVRVGQELIVPRDGEDPTQLRQGRVAPAAPSRERF